MAKASQRTLVEMELESLRKANKLDPVNVVEFARTNKKSALHKEFDWDVDRAAQEYWLTRARSIIKVYVTVVDIAPNKGPEHVRVTVEAPKYTALPAARGKENSYKLTTDVLKSDNKREQLLIATIERLASIKEVSLFPELKPVASAIADAVARFIKAEAA